ncbi:hypothetical protein I7X12_05690 [Halosimplex litoreum]|uniref:Uncharacterized protein n=1 Tax=Halosimplex litoreum TaxID=1198301 RepID=A0A7T3G0H4_9EURY|nr:hypothetical protein [Halosimplex litoreum]QPV64116.1 hypothetical protein I7X12_05690 [Halosimplex litoreum]
MSRATDPRFPHSPMRRSSGYKWSAVGVLAVLVVTPVVVVGALPTSAPDIPGGPERLYYSDDADRDPDMPEEPDPNRGTIDPARYAEVADMGFSTTTGRFQEYRADQHASLSRRVGSSLVFPHSSPRSGRRFKQAHATFMGFDSGAKPRLTGGNYPYYIAARGQIRYFADYLFVPHTPYDDGECTDTSFSEADVDSDNETEYVDGERTCYSYSRTFVETRTLELDGRREPLAKENYTGRSNPGSETFEYDLSGIHGERTLTLKGNFTVVRTVNVTRGDWDPDTGDGSETKSAGDWDVVSFREANRTFTTIATDRRDVQVTDSGGIDVDQTVVNTGEETQAVVLSFDGARSGESVSRSDLRSRPLLSSVRFGSEHRIAGSWQVFTHRQYSRTYRVSKDGTSVNDRPKNVLRASLVPDVPGPAVDSSGGRPGPVIRSSDGAETDPEVVGHESYLGEMRTASLGSNFAFEQRRPLFYGTIVVRRAASPATELETIHGNSITVDVDSEVPYVRPAIDIEAVGSDGIRVTVTDPETGAPLSGVDLSLFGLGDSQATTDTNGVVETELTGSFVRVTAQRDSWRNPGAVFHGRATESRTFLPETAVLRHAQDLVFAGVFASPVVLIYFWLRTIELEL